MATATRDDSAIDLSSHDAGLRRCMEASLIKWLHADVQNMDFHRKGRGRQEWDGLWSVQEDGVFRWDHVVRAQVTPKAQEFVLIRAYRSAEDFEKGRGLPFRRKGPGYRRLVEIGHQLMSDGPLPRWFDTCPDYALRLACAAWRRHTGMCGRVLLAFDTAGATDRLTWRSVLERTHRQYGLYESSVLSKRVFHYFYKAVASGAAA